MRRQDRGALPGARDDRALLLAVAAVFTLLAARDAERWAESVIPGAGARRASRTGAGVAVLRLAGALLRVGGAHCAEARAARLPDATVRLRGLTHCRQPRVLCCGLERRFRVASPGGRARWPPLEPTNQGDAAATA